VTAGIPTVRLISISHQVQVTSYTPFTMSNHMHARVHHRQVSCPSGVHLHLEWESMKQGLIIIPQGGITWSRLDVTEVHTIVSIYCFHANLINVWMCKELNETNWCKAFACSSNISWTRYECGKEMVWKRDKRTAIFKCVRSVFHPFSTRRAFNDVGLAPEERLNACIWSGRCYHL